MNVRLGQVITLLKMWPVYSLANAIDILHSQQNFRQNQAIQWKSLL